MAPNRLRAAAASDPHLIPPALAAWLSVFRSCFTAPVWNRVLVLVAGYLPIDKHGADLLFQIISQRYERAPLVITTNRVYKHWSQIFNNDSTLTSAILDRVLHHADTVVIEGPSFRMKDEIAA